MIRGGLLSAALLLVAGPALAIPVTHTIQSGLSMLTATVTGTFDVTVQTNLGNINGSAQATGPLASNPTGGFEVEWGAPGFNGTVEVAAGDAEILASNPGTANGNLGLDLFGFIPVNFALSVGVDFIEIGLASNLSTVIGSPPGTGPWAVGSVVDLDLAAQVDIAANGPFGINIGSNDVGIGPTVVPGIPLVATLSRVGGNPGTGTEIDITLPGLDLALPAQPPSNIPINNGCDVSIFTGCQLDATGAIVTLTSLTLTDIQGTIIATGNTPLVPEPGLALLVGGGLLAVAAARRRR